MEIDSLFAQKGRGGTMMWQDGWMQTAVQGKTHYYERRLIRNYKEFSNASQFSNQYITVFDQCITVFNQCITVFNF